MLVLLTVGLKTRYTAPSLICVGQSLIRASVRVYEWHVISNSATSFAINRSTAHSSFFFVIELLSLELVRVLQPAFGKKKADLPLPAAICAYRKAVHEYAAAAAVARAVLRDRKPQETNICGPVL